MKAGRFVQVGTAQQIVGSPADDYVAAFTQDIDRARVFTCGSVLQDAHALDLARDTPAPAMARMQQLDRDALPVLDDGRLGGIVDRKSDVQGKSVSVRVDLGGRRAFKKQQSKTRSNVLK